MPIRAGTQPRVNAMEDWLFIDLGLNNTKPTCGFLKILNPGDEEELAGNFTFGDMVDRTILTIHQRVRTPLNLVLEAPLSLTFRDTGNPITRACDLGNGLARPWNAGAGPGVTVAAIALLTKIRDAGIEREVRLFEGFVSGRPDLDHVGVCRLLRDAVWQRVERDIFSGDEIKQSTNDLIVTLLWTLGLGDNEVPSVIRPSPPPLEIPSNSHSRGDTP